MSKNIALFIDGTWNKSVDVILPESTNVYKLFKASDKTNDQLPEYAAGVGTDAWWAHPVRKIFGGLFGLGTQYRIRDAYQFLSGNYDRGDNVYLFGFSRGAFQARSLAGFIDAVGLLLRSAAHSDKVEEAYNLYESGQDATQSPLRQLLRRLDLPAMPNVEDGTVLPIYFMGVWDTVGALGLPGRMKKFSAPFTEYHQTELPSNVTHARHALAVHELRDDFEPLLWMRRSPLNPAQTLEQVWLPGAHADVGGGYPESGWSDVGLRWMASEAKALGLKLNSQLPTPADISAEQIHHGIKGVFRYSTPAVRKDLVNRRALDSETISTFSVHRSICQRLLKDGARQYQFPRTRSQRRRGIDINSTLREIDEVSLQLHLDLRFKPSPPFPPPATAPVLPLEEWWTTARVNEAANSKNIVDAFIDSTGLPDVSERERFRRALCLWLICGSEDVMAVLEKKLAKSVASASEVQKQVLLHSQYDKLAEFDASFARLEAVTQEMQHTSSQVPLHWQDALGQLTATVHDQCSRLYYPTFHLLRRDVPAPKFFTPQKKGQCRLSEISGD